MSIYFIGYDHLEELSKAAEIVTVAPFTNALYYLCPRISAFFHNFYELYLDPSLEAVMPRASTAPILREIADLTNCARIERDIVPYTTLCFTVSSCGGRFSLTAPALLLPEPYLFRKNGHSPFTQERADENLSAHRWVFSDDEMRFLIAKELGRMQDNSSLLRVTIKVAILAALFLFYTTHSGWLFIGAIGLYLVSERM
ncbi:MAG: hypothetical protein KGQ49_06920, partial [Verrucomicrobia bacterium]|nr:hypothetical protein [Verrucomicrobiota bacterium]